MPLEAKETLEYLGIKAENLEEFKASFDKDFVKTSMINEDLEPVKKILGKTFGTLENEIKKVAKSFELDVDFEADELKGKKVTDKMKFVFGEYANKNKTIIEDLTAKAGLGNDEKVKELQTKFEKEQNKAKEFKTLLEATKGEFEGYKEATAKNEKNTKLSIHKKDIFGKAQFLPDTNEFTKKGFFADFEDRYIIDIDETENPFILEKKTGAKIVSTKTAGTFKTPAEVLEEELGKAKLLTLNKGALGQPPKKVEQPAQRTDTPGRNQRVVAPRLG